MGSKKANMASKLTTQAAVPARFRCKVGGEWKALDSFSANQQKLIQIHVRTRGTVDAANSGMVCLEHSSQWKGEIRCDLCGLIKPADQFSKSMRKSDDPMCLRCTAWTETQEPGVTPAPLETGHISVEEENKEVWATKFKESTDFFPDDIMPQAPINALSSLGLEDNCDLSRLVPKTPTASSSGQPDAASTSGRSVQPSTSGSSTSMPPHLAQIIAEMAGKTKSSASRSDDAQSVSSGSSILPPSVKSWLNNTSGSDNQPSHTVPPHLKENLASRPNSGASKHQVSRYGSEISVPGSVSTASTMRDMAAEKATNKVLYNAWDSSGKRYDMLKCPTASSASAASSARSSSLQNVVDSSGGWPSLQEQANQASSPAPPPTRGKWHKAPRYQVKESNTGASHITAQHVDPDIDRQRRMKYCDSDDSDY